MECVPPKVNFERGGVALFQYPLKLLLLVLLVILIGGISVLLWRQTETGIQTSEETTMRGSFFQKFRNSKSSALAGEPPLSHLAGSWYPDNRDQLSNQLAGFLSQATGEILNEVQALILPHAGYQYSGLTAVYGTRQLANQTYSRILVMGPSHRAALLNQIALPTDSGVTTPFGTIQYDQEVLQQLAQHPEFCELPPEGEQEHSVEIQVPLLQQAVGTFTMVPLVVGHLDEKTIQRVAEILEGVLDQQTLVVASSDFTHYGPNYGYLPFVSDISNNLSKLDLGALAEIEKKDVTAFRRYCQDTGATICGRDPISVLLTLLPSASKGHLLHYETSAKMTGDNRNSVSYLAIAFTGTWEAGNPVSVSSEIPSKEEKTLELSDTEKQILLQIARKTLAYTFENKKQPTLADLPVTVSPNLKKVTGAFVTLKKAGDLRGCIGDIFPQRPLGEAVLSNALSAAFRDPRFPPLVAEELPQVHIEISVLTPLKPIDSWQNIELGKHGILLTKQGRRAVFLPQVAPEQGWNVEQTLTHLAMKAGLPSDAWKTGASFEVFEAIVFGEPGG
jgi:AmmeMemoRadiSam system protein B/AmmeMemoRadiSam system protein A